MQARISVRGAFPPEALLAIMLNEVNDGASFTIDNHLNDNEVRYIAGNLSSQSSMMFLVEEHTKNPACPIQADWLVSPTDAEREAVAQFRLDQESHLSNAPDLD